MDVQLIRCRHCGNVYRYQYSGYGCFEANSDRTEEYCPECYALLKDELEALKKKLESADLQKRYQQYQHAYVKTDEVTIAELFDYFKTNWGGQHFPTKDGWGYHAMPYISQIYYVMGNDVFKKYLVDTVEKKIAMSKCPNPGICKDEVNRCFGKFENLDKLKEELS